ncbi:MAG: DnaJ domain-containing protein [Deltaproteobacteria bacterium]|nr:MAG: DnaJ domain-containing protein [Deltaproteobacteria bacterium]
MKGWSKAVGAGLGYFVGGPIGAVLGYMAGHKLTPKLHVQEGHLLTANLLGFTTLFLKTNTAPSSEESSETVRFISRLFRFDAEDENMARELLQRLLEVELDMHAMARTFKNHSDVQMRNRLLEILATLCLLIQGPLHDRQLTLLHRIAEALNLPPSQWQVIKSRYRGTSPQLDLACCYALLDVYPEVSEEEISTAYRRLAKNYHPDHFAHLDQVGQRRHAERMTLINAAYETIRADRKI